MSFEKCCNFHPSNFKFCAVKKNYSRLFIEDLIRPTGKRERRHLKVIKNLNSLKNPIISDD